MGATLAFGVSVLVEPTVRRVNAKFGTGSYFEIFLRIPAPPRYYLHMEMKGVWLLWNDAPAGGMKTAAILGGGISKANTLERRPSRWDKDVVDPVRCGIA